MTPTKFFFTTISVTEREANENGATCKSLM